jgi:hypothetical protein
VEHLHGGDDHFACLFLQAHDLDLGVGGTIETGDMRYSWVNTTLFVARGRLVDGSVEYEVSRVS